jgi:hypothetical protein
MHRLSFAFVLVAGCTPTTFVFSPTVSSVTAKPRNCSVEVLTSTPSRDFQELGTLDLYNGTEPKTLAVFKKAVAEQVCQVGGDAAIAIADDKGVFTKGTVIAYTDSGAPVRARPGAPPRPPEQQLDNELPK